MTNLTPLTAQKQVKREYWMRVISVWVILIASAFVIVSILHIPVYVLVRSQLDAFLMEYAQASVENDSYEESEEAVKTTNELAQMLSTGNKQATFFSLIEELEALTGEQVEITEFRLSRKDNALDPIVVQGTAQSRFALTGFQEAIEAHPLFKSAELPLANLAQHTDIGFSITVVPEVIKK